MDKFKLNLTYMYLFSFGLISTLAFTEFQELHLKQHNIYRKKHQAPPLILTQELCDYAREWSDVLADEGEMRHRPKDAYGENIFKRNGTNITNADSARAVDGWYGEIKYYNFKTGNGTGVIGHFTQLVWKKSKEMGVGFAYKNKKLFIVTNYYPQGNIRRRYIENVLPAISNANSNSDSNPSGGNMYRKLALVNIKLMIINFLIVNTFFIYLK